MCEIYDDGDRASVWTARDRRAAKVHRCEGCNAVILPGEKYRYTSGVSDHRGFDEHACLACAVTRDAFGKDHGYYPPMNALGDTLHECIAEGDPESLRWKTDLDALRSRMQSANAKRMVTKAFVAWLEKRKGAS